LAAGRAAGGPVSEEQTYEDEQGAVRFIESESSAVARWEMHRSFRWEAHAHEAHQLIWATQGSVQVETEELDWAVPPTMGLWIPGGVVHSVGGADPAQMFILYFAPGGCPIDWPATTPVAITPLARELIEYLSDPELSEGERGRAEALLFDCLAPVSRATLHIPMPSDSRGRAVAEAILADPADQRDLAHFAQAVGAGLNLRMVAHP
jgi:quercetin dioxygenase-like cupin family protein